MAVTIVRNGMLYCPKCGSTYKEGTQRFCTNEGGRLLPAEAAKKTISNSKGIFSNLLDKTPRIIQNDETIKDSPKFSPIQPKIAEKPTFQTNFTSKVFKSENAPVLKDEKPIQPVKPIVRLIKQSDVHSGTADIGDRKANPNGREALTRQNPKVLVGQTIKGRYCITDLVSDDKTSFVYLAGDKIIADKQVMFRVLLDEKKDDFLSKVLSEERVSLSHINHPNVAGVLDSGELLEGNPFIVSEYVDGFSLDEKLQILDSFNPLRTARIIRQASYALSEVHQNGILHRSLKPSNIMLAVSESGTEQVKVTDFVVASGVNKQNTESLKYISPEQLEGKLPNFASDIYSLAAIAFQMLTGRLPFAFTNADQLLKAQKEGLKIGASNLKLDLSPVVDEVLEKALAYAPSERYPKARDFGDALFNALAAPSTFTRPVESEPFVVEKGGKSDGAAPNLITNLQDGNAPVQQARISIDTKKGAEKHSIQLEPLAGGVFKKANPSDDLAWEKRSPDPIRIATPSTILIAALGMIILAALIWVIWNNFLTRKSQPVFTPSAQNTAETENLGSSDPANNTAPSEEIESAPLPRSISQPPNTEYFANSKTGLKSDLLINYRGFSLYYPKTWTKSPSETNFIDISKKSDGGFPEEQFLITNYESKGTFKLDKDRFPKLVQESSKKLANFLSKFQLISEGERVVNNGWKAYEMKFQGTDKQGKITVWGRCLYIPAAKKGEKTGFLITMIATSLSSDVKSADDVGINGELGEILETFEPLPLD